MITLEVKHAASTGEVDLFPERTEPAHKILSSLTVRTWA